MADRLSNHRDDVLERLAKRLARLTPYFESSAVTSSLALRRSEWVKTRG